MTHLHDASLVTGVSVTKLIGCRGAAQFHMVRSKRGLTLNAQYSTSGSESDYSDLIDVN